MLLPEDKVKAGAQTSGRVNFFNNEKRWNYLNKNNNRLVNLIEEENISIMKIILFLYYSSLSAFNIIEE